MNDKNFGLHSPSTTELIIASLPQLKIYKSIIISWKSILYKWFTWIESILFLTYTQNSGLRFTMFVSKSNISFIIIVQLWSTQFYKFNHLLEPAKMPLGAASNAVRRNNNNHSSTLILIALFYLLISLHFLEKTSHNWNDWIGSTYLNAVWKKSWKNVRKWSH